MNNSTGRDYISLIAEGHTPALDGNGNIDLTPGFVVPKAALSNAIFIAPAAGVAYNSVITLGGTYAVGDTIIIRVDVSPNRPQKWRKTYRYVVRNGGTAIATIAAEIAAKIQADGLADAPYTAVAGATTVTITLKDDDSKGLVISASNDSTAGTVVAAAATGTISEGQPQDLIDRGVPEEEINLASYDTVKIVFDPEVPIGSIDAKTKRSREIYWFGDPGEGNPLATLINS